MTRNAATAPCSSAPSLNARPCLGGILSSEIKKLRNEPTSSSFRNLPFSAKGYAIRMSLSLSWTDIALRLLLTVIVGGIIGANRGEHGRPAGLRTTILVGLAAAMSMIEANLLLGTAGKPPGAFATLDLMRLPLGILTGMGFIGAGAIVRRGDVVQGVTTAATLWFVTMVGICFGGGQLVFGSLCAIVGFLTLWGLKYLELRHLQQRRGTLTLLTAGEQEQPALAVLKAAGYVVRATATTIAGRTGQHRAVYELRWHGGGQLDRTPDFVRELAALPGVKRVDWKPVAP
jgi:putative Mg2+ transporter-C (MgtC) family protein